MWNQRDDGSVGEDWERPQAECGCHAIQVMCLRTTKPPVRFLSDKQDYSYRVHSYNMEH